MKKPPSLLRVSLIIISAVLFPSFASADFIPAANRVDWSQAGLEGTPQPSALPKVKFLKEKMKWVELDVVADFGADKSGSTDSLAAINKAIAAATGNGTIIKFPAGTYLITNSITCSTNNVIFVGENGYVPLQDRKTIIKLQNTSNSSQGASNFKIARATTTSSLISATSGYTKGSKSMVMESVSDISVGQCYYFSQLNDPNLVYVVSGDAYEGAPDDTGTSHATRCMAQFIRITGVNSTTKTITFTPALYLDFKAAYEPAIKLINFVENCGVANMSLTRTAAGDNYQSDNGIYFVNARNCWAYNVEVYNQDGAGIKWANCFGGIMRHCYIHDASASNSGHGYGRFFFNINTGILTDDNIFIKMRHDLVYEGGGSGCVDAYNYCDDTFTTDNPTWVHGSIDTHGPTPYCNLFESNSTPKATHDNSHGNAVYNTWFRNAATGNRSSLSNTMGRVAFDFQYKNYYNAIVNCVAGMSGQTGKQFADSTYVSSTIATYRLGGYNPGPNDPWDSNVRSTTTIYRTYDYIGNTITNDAGLDGTPTASLYLTEAPGWWNIYESTVSGKFPQKWPCIGTELSPMVSKLPAQLRYEGAAESSAPHESDILWP